MEILELNLIQNREKIQNSIEALEKDCSYLQDHMKSLELSSLLNEAALVLISEDKIHESLEFLRRAEDLSSNSTRHKAICFNSIATFYRKQGKIVTALKYIERSISVHPTGFAYLNLCSVLNVQGKFDKALEIAMHTIIFVQDEIIEEIVDLNKRSLDKSETLSVCFYNLAVQLEYLKRTEEANSYYRKSVEFSTKHLPERNPIREILQQIYEKIISNHVKLIDNNTKTEFKPAQSQLIQQPQLKKRVIIKANRSKSPSIKSPLAAKEPSEKKLSRNPTSHRKFFKVGITKAKYMENYNHGKIEDNEEANKTMKLEKGQSEISLKNKNDEQKNHDKEVNEQQKKIKKVLKFSRLQSDKIPKGVKKSGKDFKDCGTEGNGKRKDGKNVLVLPSTGVGDADESENGGLSEDGQGSVKDLHDDKEKSQDESFGRHTDNEQDVKDIEFEVSNLSPVHKNYSIDMDNFMIVTGEGFNEINCKDVETKSDNYEKNSIESESVHEDIIKNSSLINHESIISKKSKSSRESIKSQEKSLKSQENSIKSLENSVKINENSIKSQISLTEKKSKVENTKESNENSLKNIETLLKESENLEIKSEDIKNTKESEKSNEESKKNDSNQLSEKDEKSNQSSKELIIKENDDSNKEEFKSLNVLNHSDDDDENNSKKEKLQMSLEKSMRFIVRNTKSNKDPLFDSFQIPRKSNNSQNCLYKLL